MIRKFFLIALYALASWGAIAPDDVPSHNAAGGYIDACGDLPGLVGDDC